MEEDDDFMIVHQRKSRTNVSTQRPARNKTLKSRSAPNSRKRVEVPSKHTITDTCGTIQPASKSLSASLQPTSKILSPTKKQSIFQKLEVKGPSSFMSQNQHASLSKPANSKSPRIKLNSFNPTPAQRTTQHVPSQTGDRANTGNRLTSENDVSIISASERTTGAGSSVGACPICGCFLGDIAVTELGQLAHVNACLDAVSLANPISRPQILHVKSNAAPTTEAEPLREAVCTPVGNQCVTQDTVHEPAATHHVAASCSNLQHGGLQPEDLQHGGLQHGGLQHAGPESAEQGMCDCSRQWQQLSQLQPCSQTLGNSQHEQGATSLRSWLQQLGLERYLEAFELAEAELSVIPLLSDSDLQEIGIEDAHDRQTLLDAACNLTPETDFEATAALPLLNTLDLGLPSTHAQSALGRRPDSTDACLGVAGLTDTRDCVGTRDDASPCVKNSLAAQQERVKQSDDKSIYDKSVFDKYVVDKSVHDKSVDEKSVYDESVYDKSVYDESVYNKSVYDESVYDKSVYDESVHDQSVHDQSVHDKSVVDKSLVDKWVDDKPVYDKPVDNKPVVDKSVDDEFDVDDICMTLSDGAHDEGYDLVDDCVMWEDDGVWCDAVGVIYGFEQESRQEVHVAKRIRVQEPEFGMPSLQNQTGSEDRSYCGDAKGDLSSMQPCRTPYSHHVQNTPLSDATNRVPKITPLSDVTYKGENSKFQPLSDVTYKGENPKFQPLSDMTNTVENSKCQPWSDLTHKTDNPKCDCDVGGGAAALAGSHCKVNVFAGGWHDGRSNPQSFSNAPLKENRVENSVGNSVQKPLSGSQLLKRYAFTSPSNSDSRITNFFQRTGTSNTCEHSADKLGRVHGHPNSADTLRHFHGQPNLVNPWCINSMHHDPWPGLPNSQGRPNQPASKPDAMTSSFAQAPKGTTQQASSTLHLSNLWQHSNTNAATQEASKSLHHGNSWQHSDAKGTTQQASNSSHYSNLWQHSNTNGAQSPQNHHEIATKSPQSGCLFPSVRHSNTASVAAFATGPIHASSSVKPSANVKPLADAKPLANVKPLANAKALPNVKPLANAKAVEWWKQQPVCSKETAVKPANHVYSGGGQKPLQKANTSLAGQGSGIVQQRSSGRGAGQRKWHVPTSVPYCQTIPIPGVSFIVDRFGAAGKPGVRCQSWFLTHFHADHYRGLTRGFKSGRIYCSATTARLVDLKLRVAKEKMTIVPLNEPTMVEGVQITFIDANHCPGAVMVLATSAGHAPVLHTGDARLIPDMQQHPSLIAARGKSILILDTTYCDPQYVFPCQQDVVRYTLHAVKSEVFNPRTLFVFGTYTIGKERLFLEVAKELGKKVYVSAAKRAVMQALDLPEEYARLLTTNHLESNFHTLPLWKVNMKGLADILKQYKGRYTMIVGFQPTGWTQTRQQQQGQCGTRTQKGTVVLYQVPYSEHSSFEELRQFVQWFRPIRVVPSVGNDSGPKMRAMLSALQG